MSNDKRTAIIVGIDEYKDKTIKQLKGAENDAKDIYHRLTTPDIHKFDIPDEHFLYGPNATAQNIRKALCDVFWKTDYYDLVLFYFAGHGLYDNYGDGWIAPYDMIQSEAFATGIGMHELQRVVSQCKAALKRRVLIILDCCYSGIATEGSRSMHNDNQKVEENYKSFINQLATGEGKIIFASSGRSEQSGEQKFKEHKYINEKEEHWHGIFSYHLIDAMDGAASDDDGVVNFEKLKNYVCGILNDTKQQPRFNISGSLSLDEIIITIASKKYEEKVKQLLQQAQDCLNTPDQRKDTDNYIIAAQCIKRVLKNKPEHSKAKEMMKKNNQFWEEECFENMSQWLNHNRESLKTKLEASILINHLCELMVNLNFEKMALLDKYEKDILFALNRVTFKTEKDDKNNVNSFLGYVRPYLGKGSKIKRNIPERKRLRPKK